MGENKMTELKYSWARKDNDVYGNPRYVIHFLDCSPTSMVGYIPDQYDQVVKLMNTIGGKRFHNKQYGGGIIFQSYSLPETEQAIDRVKAEYDAKKGLKQ